MRRIVRVGLTEERRAVDRARERRSVGPHPGGKKTPGPGGRAPRAGKRVRVGSNPWPKPTVHSLLLSANLELAGRVDMGETQAEG